MTTTYTSNDDDIVSLNPNNNMLFTIDSSKRYYIKLKPDMSYEEFIDVFLMVLKMAKINIVVTEDDYKRVPEEYKKFFSENM